MRDANLRGARLDRADLRGQPLLEGADLRGADLTCANLDAANLRGANLNRTRVSESRAQKSHHRLNQPPQQGQEKKMTDEKTGTELATQRSSALSDPEKLSALTQFAAQMAECACQSLSILSASPATAWR